MGITYVTQYEKPGIAIDGTHLHEVISGKHLGALYRAFGRPERIASDKVEFEWRIEFSDGLVATVYDWKCYPADPEDVDRWHIGAHNRSAALRVMDLIEQTEQLRRAA